jgi:hypothetical protein
MRVLILRDTVANGAPVFAGQVYDLPDADAAMLLRLRKAEHAPADAPVVPTVAGKPAARRTR